MKIRAMKHHEFYEKLPRRARYNLSDACGATATLQDILSVDEIAALASIPLIYGSVEGREDLRAGIYNLYQQLYPELGVDHITVLSGTQEGLFSIMACILEPGDEVIGMLPCYPSLSDLPACFGGVFKPVELNSENRWQPSIEDFAAQISERTKGIVINSPHNPTGMLLDQSFVDSLIALCEQHGLYLICDDVFAFSDFSGIGCQLNVLKYEKAILSNVLSKTFGLPGIRIGWVMTKNQELSKLIRDLKTYNSICQSQLDEQVACFVMQKADAIIKRNNEIVYENIELFAGFVASNDSLSWHRPEAGMLGLVHSSKPLKPLLDSWFEKDVLALPGDLFGIEGDYFRVGFGKADFPEALARIFAD
jgi:aspartate/methionine/tyrosine aminotransferase